MVKGNINSIETFGTLDGPGIRVVIFMQGCMLECIYCHNSDMIQRGVGKKYSVNKLLKEIMKYKSYMDTSKGGITLSGGEPLTQYKFVYSFLKECKKNGIHTALDTCCHVNKNVIKQVSKVCDLFMVCIKQFSKNKKISHSRYNLNKVLDNILYLSNELGKTIILRHVLVPGYTDGKEELDKLTDFAKKLKNLQFIEILPYHSMGEHKSGMLKTRKLNIPSEKEVLKCAEFIRKKGIKTKVNC